MDLFFFCLQPNNYDARSLDDVDGVKMLLSQNIVPITIGANGALVTSNVSTNIFVEIFF